MVCFILSIPRWLLSAVQQYWRLCRVLCSSAAAVEARGPVAKGKATATAPDAADAVETSSGRGGGGGEAAGDDDGIMMMGSDDEAEADPPAPLPAGDGGAEGV